MDSQYPTPGAGVGEMTAAGSPLADDLDISDHFDFEPYLSYTDGFGMDDAPLNIVWSDVIDFMESFTPNPAQSGAT